MDERLQNLINSVQKTADTVSSSATDAVNIVGRRASQLLSVGKLNMQITDLKSQVSDQLRQVGEMIYATHSGEPSSSDALLQKLQDIDALNAQISALQEEIAKSKGAGVTVCPICGATAEKGDAFCRNCGGKL